MHKLRIGVFMGGKSIEREVSFNSGRTICDHIDTSRYNLVPLFQRADGVLFILPYKFLHRGKITDFVDRLEKEAQKVAWDDLSHCIDFMYIAVHGRFAEDGTLQGFLEVLGIPYLGSKVFTSALCMNKIIQKQLLQSQGIVVPKGIFLNPEQIEAYDTQKDNTVLFPCVVKPYKEGSSLGVSVVHSSKKLNDALKKACYINGKAQYVLIEEKIEGMEFSCIILIDNKTGKPLPLPPTEIVPEDGTYIFDYDQKYMPGRAHKFTPPRCDQKIIDAIHTACIKTMHVLGITTIARIDGFVKKDGTVVVVDPNTLSGMGPASFAFREAAEINMGHADLINHILETELKQYNKYNEMQSVNVENMNRKKIRVAVLFGGDSNEKEISLESGRNVIYKLSSKLYEVVPLFVNKDMRLFHISKSLLVRNSTKEIATLLDKKTRVLWNDLSVISDFVFIALHGGKGENGSVQGTLEMLGLPYNGSSVLASALCMDKYKTAQHLQSHTIAVPEQLLIYKKDWDTKKKEILIMINETISFPMIVKPHDDGCSVFVEKSEDKNQLEKHLTTLFTCDKQVALVEECIMGMELTVGVIGNTHPQALPPSQAISKVDILSIKEKFLPGDGHNITPAPLPQKTIDFVQHVVKQAYRAVGCAGYARIDCFYQNAQQSPTKKERVVILEINTLPGMTPATCLFHQASELDINPAQFIALIIQLGLLQHTGESRNELYFTSDHYSLLQSFR